MASRYFALIGAVLGAVCGVAFAIVDVLIHYHFPYNPHYDTYPLPNTFVVVGGADGIMGFMAGAIAGGIIKVIMPAVQLRRNRKTSQEAGTAPNVWPPPPTPPASS